MAALPRLDRPKLDPMKLTDAGLLRPAAIQGLKELGIEETSTAGQGLAKSKEAAPGASIGRWVAPICPSFDTAVDGVSRRNVLCLSTGPAVP